MTLTEYIITTAGGTINTYLDRGFNISAPAPVTLAAAFSIVPTSPLVNTPITIRWNASVNLNTYLITIGGISVNQDQVNQPGTFELLYDGAAYTLQYFPDFAERPQETFGVTTLTVPAAATPLTITPGTSTRTYVLTGPTVLLGNYVVSGATSGVTNGSSVRVVIAGGITTGLNTVTVFGLQISKYDCLNGGVEVYAEYNATTLAYVATYVNKNVPLGKLSTTGFVSGDNGKLVSYDFATDSFVAAFLSGTNLPASFKGINITSTSISSGQILTSFATPITLIPASGSPTTVEVPLMFIVRYITSTTPYTTNLNGVFEYTGAPVSQKLATKNGMLGFTVSGLDVIMVDNYNLSGSANILLNPNNPITFRTATGAPAAGNGSMVIYTISTTLNL
jgi:hypothetical protein